MMVYESFLTVDVGTNPDRPRPGRMWLRNIYHVHQRLCMAFPSSSRRSSDPHFLQPYAPEDFSVIHVPRSDAANFLFQISPRSSGRAIITVRSAQRPDWDYAFQNADHLLAGPPRVEEVTYSTLNCGQELDFELVANPTKKINTLLKSERLARKDASQEMANGTALLPEQLAGADASSRATKNGKRVPVAPDAWPDWLKAKGRSHGFEPVEKTLLCIPTFYHVNKGGDSKVHKGRILAVRFRGQLRVTDPALFQDALVAGVGPAKAFGCGLLICPAVRRCLEGETTSEKDRSPVSS